MTPSQIDDGEPPEAEANRAIEEIAVVIGTTVRDGTRHPYNRLALHWFVSLEIKLASYAAHGLKSVKSLKALHRYIVRKADD
jgi:hypothetical protein